MAALMNRCVELTSQDAELLAGAWSPALEDDDPGKTTMTGRSAGG
ncbi:MAG: hypothetical protein ACRDSL_15245 [Pseudonocardiaceae bacterium]